MDLMVFRFVAAYSTANDSIRPECQNAGESSRGKWRVAISNDNLQSRVVFIASTCR